MTAIIVSGILAIGVIVVGLVYALSAVMPMLLDEEDEDK